MIYKPFKGNLLIEVESPHLSLLYRSFSAHLYPRFEGLASYCSRIFGIGKTSKMANHIAADLENDPFKFSPDGGLSQEEATIEHLLTFLDPECIHEKMLLDGAKAVQGDEFNFLREKYG